MSLIVQNGEAGNELKNVANISVKFGRNIFEVLKVLIWIAFPGQSFQYSLFVLIGMLLLLHQEPSFVFFKVRFDLRQQEYREGTLQTLV